MHLPEYTVQEVPAKLGSISVRRADTLSGMVQIVYGTPQGPFLGLMNKANPEVEDLDTVALGTQLAFPSLSPRMIESPVEGFWLSLGRFPSLEQAYRELACVTQAGQGQWVLLSGYSAARGLYFEILDPRVHSREADAWTAADRLHQALGVPVEVVSNWWKGVLFLTDQPARNLATVSVTANTGLDTPSTENVQEELPAGEESPALEEPAVLQEPPAPTKPVKQTQLAEALPMQVRLGPSRPAIFRTGAPAWLYSLLAEGIIRDYTMRAPGRASEGTGRFQAGFIQVVAHVRRDLADAEADRFVQYGWPVSVFSTDIDGRIYHRMLVGPFASPQEALDVRALAKQTATALESIKILMEQGSVKSLEGPGEAGQIVLSEVKEVEQVATLLETFGWPLLEIEGQAIRIAPFPDEQGAEEYRQRALNGMGWGPKLDLLEEL
ncbi:SPOR domain-containing protein [Desulfonatronum thiodismutans]|uniref:SPOR domain-containing protein n=1 Tax=Desulfonatronum thiodismutans TaxID=159290 RepID=UPI0004ABDD05|nr:SPOR domain-containing protein [Desulfonatronum thiodismutans]